MPAGPGRPPSRPRARGAVRPTSGSVSVPWTGRSALRLPPTTFATSPNASTRSSSLDGLGGVHAQQRTRQPWAVRGVDGRAARGRSRPRACRPTRRAGRRARPARRVRRAQVARLAVDQGGEDVLGDGRDLRARRRTRARSCRRPASHRGRRPSSSSLSRIASGVNGLMRYSWAPAASARTIWPCSLSVVTIIIVMPRHSRRARTATTSSRPVMTGMFQSMQARSNVSPASSRSRACRPSPASTVS